MKDVKEVGYANMRVYNYRKNGEVFEVNVTVYPVFDSIASVGPDAEVAVLTHFASVMTDIKNITSQCTQPTLTSAENETKMENMLEESHISSRNKTAVCSSHGTSSEDGSGKSEGQVGDIVKFDRRQRAKQYLPKFVLSAEVSISRNNTFLKHFVIRFVAVK